MSNFLIEFLKTFIYQVVALFGIIFLFNIILSKLQLWTQINYNRSVGWKGILWTAWLGTPFHEYSHAFFCKLFHHKIDEIALFRPNSLTGELGHVNHSYNQRSFYQTFGNFFIGFAPMIFGSLILVLLLYILVPNAEAIFSPLQINNFSLTGIYQGLLSSLTNLFTTSNINNGWFWLFLYVSFCIASHLAPSKEDRKGMWQGFLVIVICLAVVNLLTLLAKIDITKYVLTFAGWLNIFIAVFAYATIISLVHYLFSLLLLLPFIKKLKH